MLIIRLEGRALLMEAAALNVHQEESDLVVTAMKNLGPQWKVVKQEYLLRPTEITTFDAMEEYLLDKSKLKDVRVSAQSSPLRCPQRCRWVTDQSTNLLPPGHSS